VFHEGGSDCWVMEEFADSLLLTFVFILYIYTVWFVGNFLRTLVLAL